MLETTKADPSIGLQECAATGLGLGAQLGAQLGRMSLVEHLEELRHRLIICLIAIAVTSSISYCYAANILHLLSAPAGKLYYINPAEALLSYIKISIFTGFITALPLVMYEVWTFAVPALTKKQRKSSIILVPLSVLLFFTGMAFAYYLALPAGIKFFMGFATDSLEPLFSLAEYLSFVISFVLPFGLMFELPLIILVLAELGLVSSAFLASKRKTALVLAFVVGAVISPTPDIFSQTMIALPLLLLYEISLFIVKYVVHK